MNMIWAWMHMNCLTELFTLGSMMIYFKDSLEMGNYFQMLGVACHIKTLGHLPTSLHLVAIFSRGACCVYAKKKKTVYNLVYIVYNKFQIISFFYLAFDFTCW